MEFSLPSLFVVPVGNTLPTTGTASSALTAGQVGIFTGDAQTAVNASTVTASTVKFIQLFQGTKINTNPTNKRSDKIKAANIEEWYKIQGQGTASNEIWEVSDFTAKCNEDITLTVRGLSRYMNTISFNGLTRSVTIKTPCCDCGGSPCDTVDGYLIIYEILRKIIQEANVELGLDLAYTTTVEVDASMVTLNALSAADWGTKLGMGTFYTFTTDNIDSAATKLIITSKALTQYGSFCNIALNTQEWDRIWFRVFIYKSPDTTQDFIVFDRCEAVAATTLTQRSTFAHGLSSEILQLEYDNYSYQSVYKHLFQLSQFNQELTTYTSSGVVYDLYYIQAKPVYTDGNFNAAVDEDFRVIIAAPQTTTTSFTQAAASSGVTSGSATITLASGGNLSSVAVGQAVSGTGIPYGAFVVSISSTTLVISIPATATGTPTLTFTNSLSSGIAAILIAYLGVPQDYAAANTPTTTPLIP